MNEVMFVTGGELLQFLPISSKKRVGMSICFFGHLKEGSGWFSLIKKPRSREKQDRGYLKL